VSKHNAIVQEREPFRQPHELQLSAHVSLLALAHGAPWWQATPGASSGGGAEEHAARASVTIVKQIHLMVRST